MFPFFALPVISCHVAPNRLPVLVSNPSSSSSSASWSSVCDEAATGGPIQVVKVVALLAMTILDRQDEHKEESINCCRDFPCNSRNPFPCLNAVRSPLRLTRYLKHLACREVSLSRASRAHTMTSGCFSSWTHSIVFEVDEWARRMHAQPSYNSCTNLH